MRRLKGHDERSVITQDIFVKWEWEASADNQRGHQERDGWPLLHHTDVFATRIPGGLNTSLQVTSTGKYQKCPQRVGIEDKVGTESSSVWSLFR
jgi:hypothetical protein